MFFKSDVTFVIIGKNEALNLERCFRSVLNVTNKIIYVDSNSDDNSIEIAKKYKIQNILRFKSNYYTASLARFIGAKYVKSKLIHFLDGDMKLEPTWLDNSIDFLNNKKDAVIIHGYKKEYKNNLTEFTLKKDKRDWQSDYLQGSYLIITEKYFEADGLDYRFPGEEERDLYVRIHKNGGEVWYHHNLMSSHYDFKKRGLSYVLASNVSAAIIIPLLKNFNLNMIGSYTYVYRRLLISLIFDIFSFFSLFFFDYRSVVFIVLFQVMSFCYSLKINRIGYFVIWKSAFINFYKVFSLLQRKIQYEIEII